MVENAGLKRIRLHDLRHTYATLLRKEGQPIEAVSKVMGHANISITQRIYDHFEGEFRAPAIAMDNILGKVAQNNKQGAFVRKSLEEGKGTETEPSEDRTRDHLIKS
jgi:hypothetical protein